MSTDRPTIEHYEAALTLAVRAPSLHNTQPWRWTVSDGGLELRADRQRQLAATDLDGHGVLLACGAALQMARLGLQACGWDTTVRRLPDSGDPDLLAVIVPTGRTEVTEDVLRTARAAARRHTERRPFAPRPVPEWALDELRVAAAEPNVYLDYVERPDDRIELAVATAWADRYEKQDAGYRAELDTWTHREADTREGIPPTAIPRQRGEKARHTDVPVRDFEVGTLGEVPVGGGGDERPVFGVLFTSADDTESRLRAGEALSRVLVRVEELGLACSLMSQPVDFPGVRERVRVLMSWVDHPHMLIRIGWPPGGDRLPPTPRRGVGEVADLGRS
ncbi:MAG TPA: NAD(P)H nitroreductase [Mycobacteriales bacterium]|jgi:Nitroreductase